MSDVQTWNVSAGSNNSAAPNGFPEGMPPSGVNDAAREVMAAVARYRSDTDGVNTSSGTNTITLAASRTMTAYAQGDLFTFKAGGTNTGAATLNVDSLGAKNIYFQGAALGGGEITNGQIVTVVYDGTQFQLINPTTPLYFSGGNVGINGASGSGDKLQINTTAANNLVRFYQAGTAEWWSGMLASTDAFVIGTGAGTSTERMRIDASGNVGIGTNSPSTYDSLLAVNGNISFTSTEKNLYLYYYAATNYASISSTTSGDIKFITGTSSPAERMRVGFNGDFSSVIPGGSTLYPEFKCRAWINFDGTGTPTARGSGNVSSITDNGAGDYTINFTTALPDANYSVVGSSMANSSATPRPPGFYSLTTTTCRMIVVIQATGAATDVAINSVSIFR